MHQIVQIDFFAAVHAAPHLRVIQIQLIAAQRILGQSFQLAAPVARIFFAIFIKCQKLILARNRALLLVRQSTSCHLDKNARRVAAHDLAHFLYHQQHLPKPAFYAGRNIQIFHQMVIIKNKLFAILRSIISLYVGFYSKVIAKQLHEIIICLPQQVHNAAAFAGCLVHIINFGQQFFRKPAPAAVF